MLPLFCVMFLMVGNLSADDYLVETDFGDSIILSVDEEDYSEGFQQKIEMALGIPSDLQRIYVAADSTIKKGNYPDIKVSRYDEQEKLTPKGTGRDYEAPITDSERKDIRYIVTSMGKKSYPKLLWEMSSLTSAGKRILQVHPLRYLETVFNDEEMKVSMHNMVKKSIIWNKFLDGNGGMPGIKDSLSEEKKRNNLRQDQIEDFAKNIGIDPKLIEPSIASSNWDQFLKTLIKVVPRNQTGPSYDM